MVWEGKVPLRDGDDGCWEGKVPLGTVMMVWEGKVPLGDGDDGLRG